MGITLLLTRRYFGNFIVGFTLFWIAYLFLKGFIPEAVPVFGGGASKDTFGQNFHFITQAFLGRHGRCFRCAAAGRVAQCSDLHRVWCGDDVVWRGHVADENRQPFDRRSYRRRCPCCGGQLCHVRHHVGCGALECCFNGRDDNSGHQEGWLLSRALRWCCRGLRHQRAARLFRQ